MTTQSRSLRLPDVGPLAPEVDLEDGVAEALEVLGEADPLEFGDRVLEILARAVLLVDEDGGGVGVLRDGGSTRR